MSKYTADVIYNFIIHRNEILELKNVFTSTLFYELIDIELKIDEMLKNGDLGDEEYETIQSWSLKENEREEADITTLLKIEREMGK